jgi:threonine/homoserine/homoserine lactone efflux protein
MVVLGFGLGVLLAAQVGPVTLLIVRSVLRGGRAVLVGLAMAGAVAGVDVLYAALGLLGLGELTSTDGVRLALGLASGLLLVAIGTRTIWLGIRARAGLESTEDIVVPSRAFATALAATALNPLTIALWTVSFPAAAPSAAGRTGPAALLLLGVALGTLTWYGGFSTLVALVHRRVGRRMLSAVDLVTGAGLVAFGGVLGYRAVRDH